MEITPSVIMSFMMGSSDHAREVRGCSSMKCLPALCWRVHISTANLISSFASSRSLGLRGPWFAIEKSVHGGETISVSGRSRLTNLRTSFWSFLILRSYLRLVTGSRKSLSMDHPPLTPWDFA